MFSPEKTLAVLLSVLLVTSAGALAFDPGTDRASSADTDLDELEPADEVYVTDEGDAIFVYETDHDAETDDEVVLDGDFGVDVERGLLHLVYDGEFGHLIDDEGDEPELTGDAAVHLTPDLLSATTDIAIDRPEDVIDLSASVDHTQTRDTYSSASSLEAVIAAAEDETDDADDDPFAADSGSEFDLFDSVEFSTESTTTVSTYESSGSSSVVFAEGSLFAFEEQEERFELTVSETDGDYHLEVSEQRQVTDWDRDAWETRENAEERIESEFAAFAMGLDGTVDVSLESHDFEEGEETHAVSLEYEATFADVHDQLAEALAEELAAEGDLDLSESEAQAIADGVAALEIEHFHVVSETDGLEQTLEWDLELAGYDEFLLALFELSESIDELDDELADQLDETRELLDAQAEADLVQTSSASFSLQSDDDELVVAFEHEDDAENWADYTAAVEDRGLEEYLADLVFDLQLETDDEELLLTGSFDLEHEDAVNSYLDDLIQQVDADPMLEDDLVSDLEELRDLEFEAAKLALSLDETTFSLESGAQFGNLTTFETDDGLTITEVHGETEGDSTTVFLFASTVVDASDADDEAAIRASAYVDDDTEVHTGDWDREFPTIDVEGVSEFLEPEDDSLLSLGSTTTVAIGVGALALLAVVGAVSYRRFV
ncbi:sortase family protein [Natronobiforma cellulositropha]|uniref:hypothetical protein n=1 Tax=Natronobiforma cellulositropha TaxID=1679076 RepID=UPI0021D59F68|nr:hypothetical protein [Natronobiforma cellulositropha]